MAIYIKPFISLVSAFSGSSKKIFPFQKNFFSLIVALHPRHRCQIFLLVKELNIVNTRRSIEIGILFEAFAIGIYRGYCSNIYNSFDWRSSRLESYLRVPDRRGFRSSCLSAVGSLTPPALQMNQVVYGNRICF